MTFSVQSFHNPDTFFLKEQCNKNNFTLFIIFTCVGVRVRQLYLLVTLIFANEYEIYHSIAVIKKTESETAELEYKIKNLIIHNPVNSLRKYRAMNLIISHCLTGLRTPLNINMRSSVTSLMSATKPGRPWSRRPFNLLADITVICNVSVIVFNINNG